MTLYLSPEDPNPFTIKEGSVNGQSLMRLACNCSLPKFRENGFGFIKRYDWRVDCRPTANIDRRYVVGQTSEPTDHTGEFGLRQTIGFVYVTTSGTGAARIPRVNQEYRHANPFCFVSHERTKLEEPPAMQGCSLFATNRNPLAYSAQIFQGNCSICVFRFSNQFLAYTVVGVFGKTVFFARKPFKFAFGRACAFSLQLGPQKAVTVAHVIDMVGRMGLPIAIHSDVGNTQINPQRAFNIDRLRFFNFAGGREIKQPFVQSQVGFSLPHLKQFQLPLTTNKRDAKPPVYRQYRNGLVSQSPRKDAVIVCNTALSFEGAFCFAVEFVCIGNFRNCSYRHLRRKAKQFPYRMIAFVMQVILSKGFRFPRSITDKPTSVVCLFEGVSERVGLIGSREKFDLGNQFHAPNYSTSVLIYRSLKLFLLGFFNISFDGFCTNVSSRVNIITLRPLFRVLPPILAKETLKFFFQPERSSPFEQAKYLGRSKFWRCTYKQIYMVRPNLNCQYSNP